MTSNELINNSEDNEMIDASDEKVVTMLDVLQEQKEFEEDANAVLGASDEKNCTFSKGYIKRQAIYSCITCCGDARDDLTKRAGVCLACSLNCHENHELIELYTKRNFRCDCGNQKFNSHPCQFVPDKTELNEENYYNQNFSGLYCTCHRPYPDPDSTFEDEMIQCIICEDWLHSSHLEATVPTNEQYSEMVCKSCMDKNEFLHDYSEFAVNIEDQEIDIQSMDTTLAASNDSNESNTNGTEIIPNGTYMNSTQKDDKNIKDINLLEKNYSQDESMDVDTTEKITNIEKPSDAKSENNQNITDVDVTEQNSTESEQPLIDNKETGNEKDNITGEKSQINTNAIDEMDELSNSKTNVPPLNSEAETLESIGNADIIAAIQKSDKKDDSTEKANPADSTERAKPSANNNTTENYDQNGEKPLPTSQTIEPSLYDSESTNTKNVINENIEPTEKSEHTETQGTVTDNPDTKTVIKDEGNRTEDAEIDNIKKELTETTTNIEENIETATESNIDRIEGKHITEVTSLETENKVVESENHKGTEYSPDVMNINSEAISCETSAASTENKVAVESDSKLEENIVQNEDIGSQGDVDMSSENRLDSKDALHDSKTNTNINAMENKRKLCTEESEQIVAKKMKTDTQACIRPKDMKKRFKGATFWPSNFRQKLCTCNECISMYKDLSVLFLIDPEDTVTAYEALGQERTNGTAASQYEKGLEALSSLDRTQQINALTEYNKMKDKLLDFLKSFKDRKEIVKEEDIKQFFAGMKLKREPDGVYFCR
ncbi:hypothetical protein ACJJTC_003259 [Scirpophaga incertulas]